jgi:Holliday junction resolvasome RuvABC endonuclease subunit
MFALLVGVDPGPTKTAIGLISRLPGARARYLRAELVASAAPVLMAWLRSCGGPDEVLVCREKVRRVFVGPTSSRAETIGRSNHLIATAAVGAAFVGAAQEAGYRVLELPAETIRKQLTGRLSPSDATIKAALGGRVEGLPSRTNNHQRDAVAAALVAAMAPLHLFLKGTP